MQYYTTQHPCLLDFTKNLNKKISRELLFSSELAFLLYGISEGFFLQTIQIKEMKIGKTNIL